MIINIGKIEIGGITYRWFTNAPLYYIPKLLAVYPDAVLSYPSIPKNCIDRKWVAPTPEEFQQDEVGAYLPEGKSEEEYRAEHEKRTGKLWWED